MRNTISKWRTITVGLFLGCFVFGTMVAQTKAQNKLKKEAEQFVASGNRFLVEENNFGAAEGEYRQAIAKDPEEFRAKYNLGTAYYATQNYDEAIHRYTQTAQSTTNRGLKHMAYHNLGNTHMRQQKFDKAIAAYKDALRNNPTDEETRYNLALAKKMKEEQDKQGGGNDQNKQDGDNKDQKDKKDGDQKDGEKGEDGEDKKDENGSKEKEGKDGKEKEDKDGKEKEDEKGDPKDEKADKEKKDKEQKEGEGKGDQPNNEKNKQPRAVKGQLSPEQVKSLLEAMSNQEKKVQEKINGNKVKGVPVQTEKDW